MTDVSLTSMSRRGMLKGMAMMGAAAVAPLRRADAEIFDGKLKNTDDKRKVNQRVRLKVNEEKSKVAPSRECTFLGHTIGGQGQLRVSKKSKERMRERLRQLTKRNRGRKFETVIGEINTYLRGWLEYYRLASAKRWLAETEQWLRRKLRCYRLKQCKRRFAIAKFLMKNGLPEWRAWLLAGSGKGWYRMAMTPQASEAMSNKWFVEQGLIPLVISR